MYITNQEIDKIILDESRKYMCKLVYNNSEDIKLENALLALNNVSIILEQAWWYELESKDVNYLKKVASKIILENDFSGKDPSNSIYRSVNNPQTRYTYRLSVFGSEDFIPPLNLEIIDEL